MGIEPTTTQAGFAHHWNRVNRDMAQRNLDGGDNDAERHVARHSANMEELEAKYPGAASVSERLHGLKLNKSKREKRNGSNQ